jgi:hypothetical protein
MDRRETLSVGLKLLGVFFGVNALNLLWAFIVGWLGTIGSESGGLSFFAIFLPLVNFAVAFLFITRTDLCMRLLLKEIDDRM